MIPPAPGLNRTGAKSVSARAVISFESPALKAAVPVKISGSFRFFKESDGPFQVRRSCRFQGNIPIRKFCRRCFQIEHIRRDFQINRPGSSGLGCLKRFPRQGSISDALRTTNVPLVIFRKISSWPVNFVKRPQRSFADLAVKGCWWRLQAAARCCRSPPQGRERCIRRQARWTQSPPRPSGSLWHNRPPYGLPYFRAGREYA